MTFFNLNFEIRGGSHFEFEVRKKIAKRDIIEFTYETAVLLESGIPIMKALRLERREIKSERLKIIIDSMIKKLSEGVSLTEAFSNHIAEFGAFYVRLINIGEMSGNLPKVLRIISSYMRHQEKVRRKVESAMIYPKVVITTTLAASLFLLNFVLPKFIEMLDDRKRIPTFTRFLLGINRIFMERYLLLGGGILLIGLAVTAGLRYSWFQNMVTLSRLWIPVWGEIGKLSVEIGFLRNMELLILAGVPLIYGINMQIGTERNYLFKDELGKLSEGIKNGRGIRESLEGSRFLRGNSLAMISVGEESGNIGELFGKAAESSEDILHVKIEQLLQLLEPMLILLLALLVGSIVIGIYLPMFEMMSSAG